MSKLLVILLVLVCPATTLSNAPINEQKPPVSIAVLVDDKENWAIDGLITPEIQQAFDANPFETPYFGYTTKPHWFRLILPESYHHVEVSIIINYPSLRDITLFDGSNNPQKAGRQYPVEDWPNKARNIVFDLPANHPDTVYLRAQEKSSLIVPIEVKPTKRYEDEALIENVLYGFFFGFVIAMILYNLMLFFFLKDVTYLYYIIAMAAGGLVAAIRAGYAIVYWWPNNAILDDRIYLICGGVSVAASSRFVAHFLGFTRTHRKLNFYLWMVTLLAMGMVVLSFFMTFVQLTNYGRLLIVIGVPSFLILGIWQWIKGYRPARFFVVAWIPYSFGLVLIVLKGGGWIPYSPLVDLSAEFGTSLEAILLSLALGDRITAYKREKAEAQKRILEAEVEKQSLEKTNQRLEYDLKLREKDLQNEKQQLATTTLWLTQKNQVLQDIQQTLKSLKDQAEIPQLKEMSKKVSKNLNAEDDWIRFKEHFEKVHSGFFLALMRDFPDLTSNEQRLCAYLRMNLSTKEIALLLGVSTMAIEQARRRLRKKLGISNQDIKLHFFLQNLD